MAALGFRNIWLLELDLAQKEEGRHHATNSVYYQPENKEWDDIYRSRFDRIVPGNFGGEVRTFWAFDAGRHGIAAACRFFWRDARQLQRRSARRTDRRSHPA